MKRIFIILMACAFTFSVSAQDFGGKNSNKGHKSSGGHKGKKHSKPKKAK